MVKKRKLVDRVVKKNGSNEELFVKRKRRKINLADEYKKVLGHPGYEINRLGDVRNVHTKQILKPTVNKDGYLRQNLCNIWIYIHVAVAQQFVFNPQPEKFKVVHHKNGNPSDPRAENLEWIDTEGNNRKRRKPKPKLPPCPTPTNLLNVVWKTVEGCNCDHYEVCKEGYIRLKRRPLQVLRPFPINGYLHVSLSTNTKYKTKSGITKIKTRNKTFRLHLLLGHAFLSPKPKGKNIVVNHKDKNPLNNHISNLEWTTQQLNVVHGRGKPISKFNAETGECVKTFSTLKEAAADANVTVAGLKHRIKHNISHHIFKWQYAKD